MSLKNYHATRPGFKLEVLEVLVLSSNLPANSTGKIPGNGH